MGKSRLRLAAIVWPFIAIILAQALLASFSLQVVSSMRAYVAGESLWSKAQHDAVYFLDRYIHSADPQFLYRYNEALKGPLGDMAARLALEASPPNLAAAYAGFRAGGNHPDDIPALIWMFQNFGWVGYMKTAISDWRAAEAQMLNLEYLRAAIAAMPETLKDEDAVHRWSLQLGRINDQVTPLTTKFSNSLGEGARVIQLWLLIANGLLAAVLATLTVWRINSFLVARRGIEEELNWRATHDGLTKLPNRRAFEAALAEALTDRRANHALLFVDLDQFKIVNDTSGHAAGDKLLCTIAELLPRHMRATDLLARLGGDEFGILLHDCPPGAATAIAERLREATEGLDFVWSGQAFNVSASVGLVHIDDASMTLEEALRAADMACYMAKEKGRNRVHVYTPDDTDLAERAGEMGWVQRLHRAIETDQFMLFAQPIVPVNASGAGGQHIELLLRLRADDGSMVAPGSFIPAAERFGMMPLIDRWVVRQAFTTITRYNRGGHVPKLRSCAINLSGASLGDEGFLPFVFQQLDASGVEPGTICLEITETSAIANLSAAAEFIRALRARGCRFALDDFGAGMSSFKYLKTLEVDYLKIDGSFVKDMLADRTSFAMVEMINHIGHVMNIRTIAECVETPDVLDALRAIGVDYAQGFAIARPAPFLASVAEPVRRIA